jgi:V/A-type H+-transporting ATPase subunit E
MGLEDIFKALEEQADKDSEAVLAEARAHAEAIIGEAESSANRSREAHVAAAEKAARSRSTQDLNSVKLEARKQLAGVKERAVNDAFDAALGQLSGIRARADYPAAFRALADEALAGLEGEFVVLVDPADADLARSVLAERGLSAEVRPDLSTTGGLAVSLDGGRIMRRNTLEDRLDKLRGHAQAEVAEILFT